MQPFDKITDYEKSAIEKYIDTYSGANGEEWFSETNVQYLLRFWNQNKTDLFQIFGNKLILEREIDIECPQHILYDNIDEAIYNSNLIFVNSFYKFVHDLAQEGKSDWNTHRWLESLLEVESLATNRYDGEDIVIQTPDGHPLKIQNGCKTIRMLGKIANAFNLIGFEDFRLKHSMILNQKRFKGTLCISIHPLDYMTMSDNDCDWDSCMSWQNGGEYRMGTVECMNSPYIIVAYLKQKGSAAIVFNDMKWNSKRWRQLFVCTPELLTAIKGYPFQDNNLRDSVFDWILELTDKNSDYNYFKESSIYVNGIDNRIANTDTFKYIDLYFNIMYNDIRGNNKIYYSPKALENPLTINLSGETECVCCGRDISHSWRDFNPEMLVCYDCSGLWQCPECGELVRSEDIIELLNGEYVCTYCADRVSAQCACCFENVRKYNLVTVDLLHKKQYTGDTIYVCPDCLKDEDFVDDCGKPIAQGYNQYYVHSKNLTDSGYATFNIWGLKRKQMQEENLKAKRFWLF